MQVAGLQDTAGCEYGSMERTQPGCSLRGFGVLGEAYVVFDAQ